MKKCVTIIFLLASFVSYNQAQKQGNRNGGFNKLQSLKIAYITKQLNLSSDEATKFWPIYYSYTGEMASIRKAASNDVIAGDEKLLAVKKKYFTEFKKVLGSDERVNKFFLTEREFGNYIRKEMEERQRLRQNKS